MSDTLRAYYAQRASEYEHIYYRDQPQRQLEQLQLAAQVGEIALEKSVLEIACGTGYWTQFADRTAQSVMALDVNPQVLEVAKSKGLRRTQWVIGDAHAPPQGSFGAGMALFWISHIPRRHLSKWLDSFHASLQEKAVVLLADNVYLEGVGGTLTPPDAAGDTFKVRSLEDGSKYKVLKNYFSEKELCGLLDPHAENLSIKQGECFWWATYILNR